MYFNDADVEFLQGALRKHRLTSDAGRWLESRFCEACGTTVAWTVELRPGCTGIAGGTFDQLVVAVVNQTVVQLHTTTVTLSKLRESGRMAQPMT